MLKKYLLIFTLIIGLIGCSNSNKEETIKIGFIAGLSGKYSSLGISIRNGFVLAFDEINHKINGKKVQIIEKDDKQDPTEAKKVLNELIQDNVKLVVGNATSSMTAISIPIINKYKDMLLVSATASSEEFSSKDDNFLRIQMEHSQKRYQVLLNYINAKGYKRIFFIYDPRNEKYATGYEKIFQNMLKEDGLNGFVANVPLGTNYDDIIKKLKSINSDLILIVANSVDSSNLIQYIRLKNIKTQILASGWAKTLDFITNGGKAVEGVIFTTGYDDNSKDKAFVNFVKKYKAKYHTQPSVFAAQGYELAKILIENLRKSTDISKLKQNILRKKHYDGLQGDIVFDQYGDVIRKYFIMEVRNKEYQKIK